MESYGHRAHGWECSNCTQINIGGGPFCTSCGELNGHRVLARSPQFSPRSDSDSPRDAQMWRSPATTDARLTRRSNDVQPAENCAGRRPRTIRRSSGIDEQEVQSPSRRWRARVPPRHEASWSDADMDHPADDPQFGNLPRGAWTPMANGEWMLDLSNRASADTIFDEDSSAALRRHMEDNSLEAVARRVAFASTWVGEADDQFAVVQTPPSPTSTESDRSFAEEAHRWGSPCRRSSRSESGDDASDPWRLDDVLIEDDSDSDGTHVIELESDHAGQRSVDREDNVILTDSEPGEVLPIDSEEEPSDSDEESDEESRASLTGSVASHPLAAFLFSQGFGVGDEDPFLAEAIQRSLDEETAAPSLTPVPESVIQSLPTARLSYAQARLLPDHCKSCSICLENFQARETQRTLPCLHMFHQACIDECLRRNNVCPICRHVITLNSDEFYVGEETASQ